MIIRERSKDRLDEFWQPNLLRCVKGAHNLEIDTNQHFCVLKTEKLKALICRHENQGVCERPYWSSASPFPSQNSEAEDESVSGFKRLIVFVGLEESSGT